VPLLKVTIARHISDDPQPGLVEYQLIDAHGRRWSFVEKTAVLSDAALAADTQYPQPGVIACEVVGRFRDEEGREVIRVDTSRPWGVVSLEGETQFEVLAAELVRG
jgi:hypothetical protein